MLVHGVEIRRQSSTLRGYRTCEHKISRRIQIALPDQHRNVENYPPPPLRFTSHPLQPRALLALQVTMCCRTLLDPAARKVLKPTLLELCRQSFKQLLDKEKAAAAKQVRFFIYRVEFYCSRTKKKQLLLGPRCCFPSCKHFIALSFCFCFLINLFVPFFAMCRRRSWRDALGANRTTSSTSDNCAATPCRQPSWIYTMAMTSGS